METKIDYSTDGKNKIEIDKLHAEVAELRSRLRRWVGSLGGILGIVTAAVSILVTSDQLTKAAGESDRKEKILAADRAKLDAERAQWDAERAKADKLDAEKSVAETKERITQMRKELATAEENKAAAETAAANSLAVAAQSRVDADALAKELKDRKAELESVQKKLAELAKSLNEQPGKGPGAAAATALAVSTRNLIASEHARLVEDNKKARLFFLVLDAEQKENAWNLEKPLQEAGFYIGNVIIFGGKREETPVLRYFRDVDREEAEKMRDTLVRLGLEQTRVSRVNDPDSVGTGRKFQVWVRKENLRSPP